MECLLTINLESVIGKHQLDFRDYIFEINFHMATSHRQPLVLGVELPISYPNPNPK